jgi:ankyrin repeat protein
MHDAALAGDLAKCKELAALEPELIRAQDGGLHQTPLHWASFAGQLDVVAWLLAQGVDVNAKDRFRSTPLHGAAFAGRTAVAGYLLDRGADANAADDDGFAPLDLAAGKSLETAKLLVARGARIEGGPSGADPIFEFARHGNREGVDWALSLGARITTKNMLNGWTALHWLAKGAFVSKDEALAVNLSNEKRLAQQQSVKDVEDANYLEVFRVLLANGAALDARGNRKETPLHLAAEAGNLTVATALLDAGAQIDPREHDEWTPLHQAAQSIRGDIVRLLVARGADVDAKDHGGFTPLIIATRWGGGQDHATEEAAIQEVVKALIAGRADVNAKTPGGGWGPAGNDGLTALQQAAESGHASVVELLLRSGADVNKVFTDGRTPLYWAAKEGRANVVASLIAHGANVNADAKSRTALRAAREGGHQEIVDMLLAHGARP